MALLLARVSLLVIPFKYIAHKLGTLMAESTETESSESQVIGQHISWAIREASKRTPWQSKCLAQAMAAKWMLQRRRIASTLYLGMAKDESGKFAAHAWLRSGTLVLTGERMESEYIILSSFA